MATTKTATATFRIDPSVKEALRAAAREHRSITNMVEVLIRDYCGRYGIEIENPKGEPTRKIWYYGLADLKVTKRKPLTLTHFEKFFVCLPDREDSDLSWAVDLDARKQQVAEQAKPLHDEAREKTQQAARWKEQFAELKKPQRKQRDEQAINVAAEKVKALTKEARALSAKGQDIENAVYDLKAVNANKKPVVDARTPAELLDIIDAKGREIDAVLAELRTSL